MGESFASFLEGFRHDVEAQMQFLDRVHARILAAMRRYEQARAMIELGLADRERGSSAVEQRTHNPPEAGFDSQPPLPLERAFGAGHATSQGVEGSPDASDTASATKTVNPDRSSLYALHGCALCQD